MHVVPQHARLHRLLGKSGGLDVPAPCSVDQTLVAVVEFFEVLGVGVGLPALDHLQLIGIWILGIHAGRSGLLVQPLIKSTVEVKLLHVIQ